MRKAGSLIRQQFGLDPFKLTEDKFADLAAQAIWLKQYDQQLMEGAVASVIAKMFGG